MDAFGIIAAFLRLQKELRTVEERLRSLNSQQSMMLDDVRQAQLKDTEKSQLTVAPIDGVQPADSLPSAVPPSPNQSLTDSKSVDSLPVASQELSGPPDLSTVAVATPLLDDAVGGDDELSAALSAIVDSEDLSAPSPMLPEPQPANPEPSLTLALVASPPAVAEPDASAVQMEVKGVEPSADKFVEPVEKSEPGLPAAKPVDSAVTATIDTLQKPKPEKKSKAKKPTKEKTTKTSKRKSKVPATDPASVPGVQAMLVAPSHSQQPMPSLPHAMPIPVPPHQGMTPSQSMQPIAPLPTSQPIMFVQSQTGAPMIIQQPGVVGQPMTAPMMSSPRPGMPYSQTPVQPGHQVIPMQPSMQHVMPTGNSQQVGVSVSQQRVARTCHGLLNYLYYATSHGL